VGGGTTVKQLMGTEVTVWGGWGRIPRQTGGLFCVGYGGSVFEAWGGKSGMVREHVVDRYRTLKVLGQEHVRLTRQGQDSGIMERHKWEGGEKF